MVSEFRIFAAGWNDTSKGRFLFDEKAAKQVMADYAKTANDIMIDLEHLSLDSEGNNYDPDAYGWCKLELRAGELWATNVKWTREGMERLSERRQRYVSPAFSVEEDSSRIASLYNVAICAIPATYEAPALVAASKRTGKKYVTLAIEVKNMEELKKIALALGLEEDATLEDILAAIKAMQGDDETAADDDKPDEKAADDDGEDKEKMSDDEKELSKLPPKLQAKVMAALSSTNTLKTEIESIKRKQRSSEVESLIAANTDKIPLAMEGWARKQTVETLTEYLKHAVAVPRGKAPPKDERATEVKLTKEEIEVCKQTNLKPEVLLAKKKKDAEARAAAQ